MRLRTPCARKAPTEACVKQHLGAVAETGEEGARLLPPQPFWPLARHPVMRAVNPRGISTRCLLTRHPFRLSTLPGDFMYCGQAIGAFARERAVFVFSDKRRCWKSTAPKLAIVFACAVQNVHHGAIHAEIAWRRRVLALANVCTVAVQSNLGRASLDFAAMNCRRCLVLEHFTF